MRPSVLMDEMRLEATTDSTIITVDQQVMLTLG